MRKIGIVTELNLDDVNYGNHLQSYALNQYLSLQYPEHEVETFLLPRRRETRIYASAFWWFIVTFKRCYNKFSRILVPSHSGKKIDIRFKKFIQFARSNININDEYTNWRQLVASDYEVIIVGSDVVWQQRRGCIRNSRFLVFSHKQEPIPIKIAYAASFGNNFIPRENVKIIRKYLSGFKAISVREKSAVGLLESIGIKNVVHVCDPTLLLSKEQWMEIEKNPKLENSPVRRVSGLGINDKFCFAYMLGQDQKQREAISRFCKRNKLILVTVPYVNGYQRVEQEVKSDFFGDIPVMSCSPQEWVWLVHHAEYVVTDSFHGLVFSTVFNSKFIVMRRAGKTDMNIRLEDYLEFLGEKDKSFDVEKLDRLSIRDTLDEMSSMDSVGRKLGFCRQETLTWDYEKIQKRMEAFILKSKDYLDQALSDVSRNKNSRHISAADWMDY